MDLRGAGLLAAALVSLQLGVAHHAWLLAPALLFGWLFVRRERSVPSPAVDLSVLRYRPLAGTLAAAPLYGIGLYASIFLIPLLFERQLSMSATDTGIALAVGAVTSGVLIVCAQPLLTRFRARSLCAAGAVLFAAAVALDGFGQTGMVVGLVLRAAAAPLSLVPMAAASRRAARAGEQAGVNA